MDEFNHRILALCNRSVKGLKNSTLNGDLNPDLCDASAVLHQLSYQVTGIAEVRVCYPSQAWIFQASLAAA